MAGREIVQHAELHVADPAVERCGLEIESIHMGAEAPSRPCLGLGSATSAEPMPRPRKGAGTNSICTCSQPSAVAPHRPPATAPLSSRIGSTRRRCLVCPITGSEQASRAWKIASNVPGPGCSQHTRPDGTAVDTVPPRTAGCGCSHRTGQTGETYGDNLKSNVNRGPTGPAPARGPVAVQLVEIWLVSGFTATVPWVPFGETAVASTMPFFIHRWRTA